MTTSRGRRAIPDESNGSRRMAEASLEESATHDLVGCHQCCQCLTEHHVNSSDTNKARSTNRFVDGERKTE